MPGSPIDLETTDEEMFSTDDENRDEAEVEGQFVTIEMELAAGEDSVYNAVSHPVIPNNRKGRPKKRGFLGTSRHDIAFSAAAIPQGTGNTHSTCHDNTVNVGTLFGLITESW